MDEHLNFTDITPDEQDVVIFGKESSVDLPYVQNEVPSDSPEKKAVRFSMIHSFFQDGALTLGTCCLSIKEGNGSPVITHKKVISSLSAADDSLVQTLPWESRLSLGRLQLEIFQLARNSFPTQNISYALCKICRICLL